nr:MAG TPA: hypothetical protein [Caudoviricetes sp.]
MTAIHQVENISKQIRGGKVKRFACVPHSTREEEITV